MTAEKQNSSQLEDMWPSMTGGGSVILGEKNIYSQSVARRIKSNIKQEWERQKHLHGKTQEELSLHLVISQGAVSKLLNDKVGHPWTVDKIELFAKFCDVSLTELIGDTELIGHFNGWSGDTAPPTAQRINEAKIAIERFTEEHGTPLDDAKLHRLAGRLAVRVENTDRSPKSYSTEIMKLLISEAGS